MKKSLTINATRNGKKVSKSLGFVNPNVANSIVGGFAQMVNNLTTDTFVNAQVVKVMDTTEEDTSSQSSTPAAKTEPTLTIQDDGDGSGFYYYNGDGDIFGYVPATQEVLNLFTIDRSSQSYNVIDRLTDEPSTSYSITLYATETANFAAKSASFTTG